MFLVISDSYEIFTNGITLAVITSHEDYGMKRKQGFTLIEMMIVLAIITIGVMVAIPNLQSWFGHYGAVDFQRELLSRVNEARTRSLASNLRHRLLFDRTAGSVTFQRLPVGSSTWLNVDKRLVASRGAGINDISVDNGAVSGTSYAMVFNPGGQVMSQTDPANDNTISPLTEADIHLSASHVPDRATIRVFGWTSRARLQNGW